jgi:hypothetical protein
MSLPEPAYLYFARMAVKYKFWIILGVIIGGAILMDEFKSPSAPRLAGSQTTSEGSRPSSLRPTINYPPVFAIPGIQQVFTYAERIAPFTIISPSGAESYYVKLTDASTGVPVMTLFVRGGQSFTADVPLGSYRVKYAKGTTWYGDVHLFGPETRYSEADKTFSFSVQGNQVNGYTVTLIRQSGGNLHTKSISANNF